MANPFSTQIEVNNDKSQAQANLNQISVSTANAIGSAIGNTVKDMSSVIANGIGAEANSRIGLDQPNELMRVKQKADDIIYSNLIPEDEKLGKLDEMLNTEMGVFLQDKGIAYTNIFNSQYKDKFLATCKDYFDTSVINHLNTVNDANFKEKQKLCESGQLSEEEAESMVNDFEIYTTSYLNGQLAVVKKRYDKENSYTFMPKGYSEELKKFLLDGTGLTKEQQEQYGVEINFWKTCIQPLYVAKIGQVGEGNAIKWMEENIDGIADRFYVNSSIQDISLFISQHPEQDAYEKAVEYYHISDYAINPLTGKTFSNAEAGNAQIAKAVDEERQRRADLANDFFENTVMVWLNGDESQGIESNPFMTSEEFEKMMGGVNNGNVATFLRDLNNVTITGSDGKEYNKGALFAAVIDRNDQNLIDRQFEATQDPRVVMGNTTGLLRLLATGDKTKMTLQDIYDYQNEGIAQTKALAKTSSTQAKGEDLSAKQDEEDALRLATEKVRENLAEYSDYDYWETAKNIAGIDPATGVVDLESLKGGKPSFDFGEERISTQYGNYAVKIAEQVGITDFKSNEFKYVLENVNKITKVWEDTQKESKKEIEADTENAKIAHNQKMVNTANADIAKLEYNAVVEYYDYLMLSAMGLTDKTKPDASGARDYVVNESITLAKIRLKTLGISEPELAEVHKNATFEFEEEGYPQQYYELLGYAGKIADATGEDVYNVFRGLQYDAIEDFHRMSQDKYNGAIKDVTDKFNNNVYLVNTSIDKTANKSKPTLNTRKYEEVIARTDEDFESKDYDYNPLTGIGEWRVQGKGKGDYSLIRNPAWSVFFETYMATRDIGYAKLAAQSDSSLSDEQIKEITDISYDDLAVAFIKDSEVLDRVQAGGKALENIPSVKSAYYQTMINAALNAHEKGENVSAAVNDADKAFFQNQTLVSLGSITTMSGSKIAEFEIGDGKKFSKDYIDTLKALTVGHTNGAYAQNGAKYLLDSAMFRQNSKYYGDYTMSLVGLDSEKELYEYTNIKNTFELTLKAIYGTVPAQLKSAKNDSEYIKILESLAEGDTAIFGMADLNMIFSCQSEILAMQKDYLLLDNNSKSLIGNSIDATDTLFNKSMQTSNGLNVKITDGKPYAVLNDGTTMDISFMVDSDKYKNTVENIVAGSPQFINLQNYSRYSFEGSRLAGNQSIEKNRQTRIEQVMALDIDAVNAERDKFRKLIESGYTGSIPYIKFHFKTGSLPVIELEYTTDKTIEPMQIVYDSSSDYQYPTKK